MSYRAFTSIALFASLLAATACSAGDSDSPNDNPGGDNDLSPDDDGLAPGGDDGPTGRPDDSRADKVPVRKKVCDDQGRCTCLRLALLGTFDSGAADGAKDPRALLDWLNNSSDGTATMTRVDTKPTLTADYLAQFDILVVANINTWGFTEEEKAAVATWVREGGGGIVNLSGFESNPQEPGTSSQLISFAGLQYSAPEASPGSSAQGTPVYYKNGTKDLKNCLHWNGSVGDPQITGAVRILPQEGELGKLTHELNYVGAFHGWTVQGPAGSTVIANDPVSTQPVAVAHEVDGAGRIFAFGDEWVSFANQWLNSGTPHNTQQDTGNACYQPAEGETPAFIHGVQSLYQTKQFWYNAINWVAPPNECNFVVDDPEVIIVR